MSDASSDFLRATSKFMRNINERFLRFLETALQNDRDPNVRIAVTKAITESIKIITHQLIENIEIKINDR